jgi:hypothetical protein
MGAWGTGTLDNDTACDWGYDLEESDDLSLVGSAFTDVLENDEDYLDQDPACNAVAACEVLARLKGNWGVRNAYTGTVDKSVETHPQTPPAALVQRANQAIDRILTDDSELRELWAESGDTEWLAAVEDLRRRLNA